MSITIKHISASTSPLAHWQFDPARRLLFGTFDGQDFDAHVCSMSKPRLFAAPVRCLVATTWQVTPAEYVYEGRELVLKPRAIVGANADFVHLTHAPADVDDELRNI